MNKKSLIILPIILLSLTSCGSEWSWWEKSNVNITKGILLSDAKSALESSSKRFDKATSAETKYSKETFLKNYLGEFATEWDSNVNISTSSKNKKYNGEIIVKNYANTQEINYPNAKQYANKTEDTYMIGQTNKDINVKTFTYLGYGKQEGKEIIISYTSDDAYKLNMSLGSVLSVDKINWLHASYGMTHNDSIIIEETNVEQSSISITMTGQDNVVTTKNTYRKYRFAKGLEGETTVWTMDYSYEKIEVKIANDVFNEPMKSPFLLERSESSTTYNFDDNGVFDISKIPTII